MHLDIDDKKDEKKSCFGLYHIPYYFFKLLDPKP